MVLFLYSSLSVSEFPSSALRMKIYPVQTAQIIMWQFLMLCETGKQAPHPQILSGNHIAGQNIPAVYIGIFRGNVLLRHFI